ncbi:MAG TPA: Stk1 family PASTA domain-containing Ser/Thr kinase [Amnibacterium sp.]|uniref:Stk1 family PASTA domain-containing Ser/Thr kinase n=1 Tax=Amnibacterium sp. TaxID=1872496 RepID=UPI002F93CC2E
MSDLGSAPVGRIANLESGERLLAGRYRVEQLLGRGGMAEVHLGMDLRLGRRVAIKLLRSSLANDPVFRMRFRQEAQSASRMTHPTIVRVFDAGEETVLESGGGEAQLPFIVMEFVDGKLLKDLIKDGPMTAAEAGHIVSGILTALEYSHEAGVVHRDIKPANVMVTRSGQVKVMDFGIARAISDSSATVAQTTAILGTAQYFSPEQAKGETVDPRSDLYSTGIVLFEMLTGRAPFTGDSPIAVAYQHVSEPAPPPSDLNPRVSEGMDAVVLRALEKDKNHRYQSAEEFRADVEAVVAGRPPVARLPVIDPDVDLFGGAVETPEATVRQLAFDDYEHVTTSNRPPVAWVWAGVLCVAVVVLAVALWVVSLSTGGFGADQRTIPTGLSGSTETSAVGALDKLDLHPLVHHTSDDQVPSGEVIRTSPVGGTTVQQNTTVEVWVSTGVPKVTVPTLTSLSLDAAQKAIAAAGLQNGSIVMQHSKDVPKDVVMSAVPADGTSVPKGATVDLTVSDGQVQLGSEIGKPRDEASADLTDLGLTPNLVGIGGCGPAADVIIGQKEPAGAIDQGSTVTLNFCDGS